MMQYERTNKQEQTNMNHKIQQLLINRNIDGACAGTQNWGLCYVFFVQTLRKLLCFGTVERVFHVEQQRMVSQSEHFVSHSRCYWTRLYCNSRPCGQLRMQPTGCADWVWEKSLVFSSGQAIRQHHGSQESSWCSCGEFSATSNMTFHYINRYEIMLLGDKQG